MSGSAALLTPRRSDAAGTRAAGGEHDPGAELREQCEMGGRGRQTPHALFPEVDPKVLTRFLPTVRLTEGSCRAHRRHCRSSLLSQAKTHLWGRPTVSDLAPTKVFACAAELTSYGKWEAEERVLPSILADFDLMKRTFEKLFIPWQCRSSYRNKHRSINLGTAASIHYKSCQKSFISCKGCCVSLKNAGFNVRFGVRV